MSGLCIITLFAHKTYKENKIKQICEVFAGMPKLLLRRYMYLLVNGGLCGRTFGVYQSSYLIGIQFLIGYRVDSLIIELYGQSIVCSKENIIDTIVKSNEKEKQDFLP